MSVTSSQNLASVETKQQPLLHELQLGEQLNECVHQTRRADFALMLAMLADDVREQSQFILPQADAIKEADNSNQALRKQLELADKAPLSLPNLESIDSFNQAKHVQKDDLASIRLSQALTPNALAFRDDKTHVPTVVMSNTSLYCQTKHRQRNEEQNKPLNKQLSFDAKAWLSGIQNSLVKAPLAMA